MRNPRKIQAMVLTVFFAFTMVFTGYGGQKTLAASSTADTAANEIIKGFTYDKWGNIQNGPLSFGVQFRDKNWTINRIADTLQFDAEYPKVGENTFSIQGNVNLLNGAGNLRWQYELKKTADNSFNVTMNGESAAPIQLNSAAFIAFSSVDAIKGKNISVDGQKINLPVNYKDQVLFSGKCNELIIPYNDTNIVITGITNLLIQDDRKWNQNTFEFRIDLTPGSGSITQTSGDFTITQKPFDNRPIDISSASNMGFADEIADDKTGGWTDQGKENDLSAMQPGRQVFGGLPFDIIDPAKNNGTSSMIFGIPSRNYLLQQAELKNVNDTFSYLYLLHAIAWPSANGTQVGTIQVQYTDGTKQDISVVQGREVGNWWTPVDYPNGMVVWKSKNGSSSDIGLYLSKFPIESKPVQSIVFLSTGKSVWMVAGLTGSDGEITLTGYDPTYITEGPMWKALPVQKTDIASGSILDLSTLQNNAPAGQYGRVVIKDGHFEFQELPGKQQKFYGTNITYWANFLEKPEVDKFVELYKKMGYNAIRIHHYERDLVKAGATTSLEFDPAQFDRLDYLFAKLKEIGVYFTTDMYVTRPIKKDEIPGYPDAITDAGIFKSLVMVYQPAMENWKAFSKEFLLHKNPYTGMTWAEDPALFSISTLNEDWLVTGWNQTPRLKELTLALFEEWKAKQKIGTLNPDQEKVVFDRFLIERQTEAYVEMTAYLKTLGVKAVFSDGNIDNQLNMEFHRNELDYVDAHGYWDHPRFVSGHWQLPFKFTNKSIIPSLATLPRIQSPDRIIGKPFTFSEFNYVYPNSYRAEGGAVFGGYAALQDWDAVYRFDLVSNRNVNVYSPSSAFDIMADPIGYLTDKLAILLFKRGDVAPAKGMIPFALSERYLNEGENYVSKESYPNEYTLLSLFTKVGTVILKKEGEPKDKEFAAVVGKQDSLEELEMNKTEYFKADSTLIQNMINNGILSKENIDIERQIFKSDTGEITIDGSAGTFKIVTPKTEAFVIPDQKSVSGNILTAESKEGFAAVSASAMDGETLESSKRILVMHLTDVKNSNTKFLNKEMTVQETNGGAPSLVRSGKAEITMKLNGDVEVYGCDLMGNRIESIPVTKNGDGFTFTAQTVKDNKAAYLVYEVVRK